jgi:CRISPR-associated protein Cas2
MKKVASYVVVYDISDNKERRAVNKVLIGFGFRVQKSVFECRLDKRYYNQLKYLLSNLDIKTGFIKIYKKEKLKKDEILGIKNNDDIDAKNAYIF